MRFPSLSRFLEKGSQVLSVGPIALIFVEDEVELSSTLEHHLACGFARLVLFMPEAMNLDLAQIEGAEERVVRVDHSLIHEAPFHEVVTLVSLAAPTGTWFYYCFNAEYLYFPFCEDRSVGEMLAFHGEERRSAMLSFVVDLYARDLSKSPNAVSLEQACLDRTGYYALSRRDGDIVRERQLNFFGGLRWRFEEHVPADRRRIDRVALFRSKPGLVLNPDHRFSEQEYNTYSCPWHHNLSASIASFRTAKALKTNPGSRDEIETFEWHNSVKFEWSSGQLLNLGLMEPGQWF